MSLDDLVVLTKSFDGIVFSERDHSYKIDGKFATSSVTQLLKKFEKPFDEKTVARIVAKRDGMPVEEVLDLWRFKRDYAGAKGTQLHHYAENFLQRRQVPLESTIIEEFVRKNPDYISKEKFYEEVAVYIKNFINFYEWWKLEHILISTEMVVGDRKTGLCGCIDNLSYNFKTKELVIFDYKTNKEMGNEPKKTEKMLGPLKHLICNNQNKYSLQQDLYSLIIERNTPFKLPSSYVVWIGSDSYELFASQTRQEASIILETLSETFPSQ